MIIILSILLVIAILIATYFIINYNTINDILTSLTKAFSDLMDENVALKIVIQQYQRKLDEHEKECCIASASSEEKIIIDILEQSIKEIESSLMKLKKANSILDDIDNQMATDALPKQE